MSVAVVTGAARGIGLATARRLAAAGHSVALTDIDVAAAQAAAAEIDGTTLALAMDVTDPAAIRDGLDAVERELGAPTLFVNNAGIGGPEARLADVSDEDYLTTMRINTDSVFYCLKAQLPRCVAAGGGAIVNVSSVLGRVGDAELGPYVASKHAVAGLTKSAALGYAPHRVRVNSVHPGYIDTAINATLPPEVYAGLPGLHALGRLGDVDEVATVICFLLSDDASFVTGTGYDVDGGYLAR